MGAEAIIDFVGEKGAVEDGVAMIQDGGFYYVIGYGQNIDIPTIDVISREISFIGNLVGTYVDLQDLMTLTAQGKVTLHTTHVSARRDQRRDGRPRQRAAAGPGHPRPGLRRHTHGQDPPLQPRRAPAAAGGRRRARRRGQGDARPEGPQRRPRAPHRRADDHQRRRQHRARDRALGPVQEHGRAARPRGRDQDERPHRRRHDHRHAARPGDRARGHAHDRRGRQPDAAAPRDRGRHRSASSSTCARRPGRCPAATTCATSRRSPARRT